MLLLTYTSMVQLTYPSWQATCLTFKKGPWFALTKRQLICPSERATSVSLKKGNWIALQTGHLVCGLGELKQPSHQTRQYLINFKNVEGLGQFLLVLGFEMWHVQDPGTSSTSLSWLQQVYHVFYKSLTRPLCFQYIFLHVFTMRTLSRSWHEVCSYENLV